MSVRMANSYTVVSRFCSKSAAFPDKVKPNTPLLPRQHVFPATPKPPATARGNKFTRYFFFPVGAGVCNDHASVMKFAFLGLKTLLKGATC